MRTISGSARCRFPVSYRLGSRKGFTLIEMLVVMVIMGILMSIALPRFGAIRDKAALSSTKQRLIGYLATTRAAAIRQSSTAEFRLWDNNVSATVTQPDGTKLSLGSAEHLDKTQGVVITRGTGVVREVLTFDSRGLLTPPLLLPYTYVVTRNNVKDSICVSRLGLIARKCGS